MKSYKFIINGIVQNISYRKTIYENATLIGFNGYIKSLTDGSIEACITPKNDLQLKQFRKILKKGSMNSKVTSLERFDSSEEFSNGFELRN